MKKINFLVIISFVLVSCGGIKDAGKVLRNEKTNSTDEFLVKKRNPLVLPPNFEELPEPGAVSKNENNNDNKIKEILKAPKVESTSSNKSSSIEQSILNRIRK
jgi:hypothetical protein|tara:strand:+ start:132 stop:440 length:309 start_codon:yes stop_codon:yes gene_type:complete